MSTNEPPPPGGPPGGPPPQGPPPGGGYPPPGPPPGGGYPPPGGGYPPPGPPPGGGYPPQGPPPGGGYPGQGGFGGPPPQRFSIGEAFNYGWTKFQQNVGVILLAALAWIAIIIVIQFVWYAIMGGVGLGLADDSGEVNDGGLVMVLIASGLFALVAIVVGYLMQAGIIRGALQITYGRELTVGTTFSFANIGPVLISAVLIAIMTAVGLVLCYIPGLIVGFFTQYTMFFIIDKDMGAIDAIKASASFVNRNLGVLIGFYIASIIAFFVGALLCGVGLLLAIPVVIIAQTYAYRVLQGEAVAP